MRTSWTRRVVPFLHPIVRLGTAWTLTWIVIFVDILWIAVDGWSISWRGATVVGFALLICVAILCVDRYRRDPRIRATLQAVSLLVAFMAAAAVLSYLVVSTNAPLVDADLAAWDRALGFDWLSMHRWLQEHPSIQAMLRVAYFSGLVQLALVVLFLGFSKRAEPLEEFTRLYIIATLLTVLVSGAISAAGAWKYYGITEGFDFSSLSHFEPLRNGTLRTIELGQMQGLISIPSLHAAMAVLLVYAVRGVALVMPLFLVLNAAMVLSTPIDGSHYLVDVVAGIALAAGLIAVERRRGARHLANASACGRTGLEAPPG